MDENETLPYQSSLVSTAKPPWRPGRIYCAILIVLTLMIAGTATTIEVLNVRAGGILPNREFRDNDPAQGVVKWRGSIMTTEKKWREWHSTRDPDSNIDTRPLTATEATQMNAEIAQAVANNTLLDFVQTWGLLQYLLLPTVIIMAAAAIFKSPAKRGSRALFLIPLAIALAAAGLFWHRAYFTSLGI